MANESKLTTWQLANLADCASPDAHDGIGFDYPPEGPSTPSAGAVFLRSVETAHRDALAEPPEDGEEWSDRLHELADAAPDVYTLQLWREFVDLAAWQADVSEFDKPDDMEHGARMSLYAIAMALLEALHAIESGEAKA